VLIDDGGGNLMVLALLFSRNRAARPGTQHKAEAYLDQCSGRVPTGSVFLSMHDDIPFSYKSTRISRYLRKSAGNVNLFCQAKSSFIRSHPPYGDAWQKAEKLN